MSFGRAVSSFLAAAGLALVPVPSGAQAQSPSAAPPAGAAATQESAGASLGRLFYSPQQRAALDAERRALLAQGARPAAKPAATPRQAPAEPREVARTYTLRGIVRRSDGENTVWLNDRVVNDNHSDASIAIRGLDSDEVGVRLSESNRRLKLKVGQSVRTNSGNVTDAYQRDHAAGGERKRPDGTTTDRGG